MLSSIRSYRVRLFIIFLVSISPFIIFDIYGLSKTKEQSLNRAIEHSRAIMDSMSTHHRVLLETIEREMYILSKLRALNSTNYRECNRTLADILNYSDFFTNIALVNEREEVLCSGRAKMRKVSKVALSAYQKAMDSSSFSIGSGAVSENHGLPIIPFALPLKNHSTLKKATLMAGVSLRWLNSISYDIKLSDGIEVFVINEDSNIIGTIPIEHKWLGKQVPSNIIIPKERDRVFIESEDKIWIFGNKIYDIEIISSIDKTKLLKHSDSLLQSSILMIVIMFLLAEVMSIFVSRKLILKEVENLLSIATEQIRISSVSELLTNIAHHWRNPLFQITVTLDLIAEDIERGEFTKESILERIDKIIDTSNELSEVINEFSLSFRDRVKEREPFNIKEPLERVKKIFYPQLKKEDIDLSIEYLSKDIYLTQSKSDMVEVISYLINNSIDALIENRVDKRWIKISIKRESKGVIITIEDNGSGVKPDIYPKIFEPYVTSKFKSKGVGVSLYIVKSIVEQNFKGSIGVLNSKDGAIFTLKFPLSI